MPDAAARRVDQAAIAPWRARFLAEIDAQVRYDATHRRGWADVYAVSLDGADVGYGAIKGFAEIAHRDALFELYVDPAARPRAVPLARAVLAAAGADHLQCQTNDAPYHDVFRQLATDVEVEAILFADDRQTDLAVPGAIAGAATTTRSSSTPPSRRHESGPPRPRWGGPGCGRAASSWPLKRPSTARNLRLRLGSRVAFGRPGSGAVEYGPQCPRPNLPPCRSPRRAISTFSRSAR